MVVHLIVTSQSVAHLEVLLMASCIMTVEIWVDSVADCSAPLAIASGVGFSAHNPLGLVAVQWRNGKVSPGQWATWVQIPPHAIPLSGGAP